MKKLLFTFLLVGGLITVSQAQLGIRGGLNMTNLTGDEIEDNKGSIGFHFGLVYGVAISDNLKFRPGLLYSSKGSKDSTDDNFKFTSTYLEIPLNLKYNVSGSTGFFIEGGPYLGYLMSAKAKVGDIEIDLKDTFSGIDFGLNIGIGYDINSNIGIGAHYGLGLGNVADDPSSPDASANNSNISFYIVYSL